MTTYDVRGFAFEQIIGKLVAHARQMCWQLNELTVVCGPGIPGYFYDSDRRCRIEYLDGLRVTVYPRPEGDIRFAVCSPGEDEKFVRVERAGDRLPLEFIVE